MKEHLMMKQAEKTEKPNPLIHQEDMLRSPFAEAYRALRANITFSGVDHRVRSVAVTSAAPGEGKTTTAINLAIIMAQALPRVILIDADFRRPGIDQSLGAGPPINRQGAGLSDVIVGSTKLEDVVLETSFTRLFVIPAGAIPPNPNELLGSKRMEATIKELTELADFVIFDTPPCLLYSDAYVMSRLVDGVLYVLRAGAQNKAAQRRVQRQFTQSRAHVIGVVFNAVDVDDDSSAYDIYGYYRSNGQGRK
jgi:capsular exopolysaccharide synthesis family protein